jgi:hypothetical protein
MLFGSDPGEMGVPVDHDPTVAATRARFWMQLRYLCQPFPNLRRLLLSFTGLMYNDYSRRPSEALEDMDTVLLRPLAAAVARLPQLRVPVVVELPEAVCRELSSRESIAKLGITVEWYPRTAYQSWIRYPVSTTSGSANGDDSGDIATLTPDVQGNVAGETARENQFYYIVRGDEDSLRWNYLGKPYHPAHHIGNCGI